MNGRRIPVDLGPLSLNLLEDRGPHLVAASACVDDVFRLQTVMRGGTASRQSSPQNVGFAGNDDDVQANTPATAAPSHLATAGLCDMATLDEAHLALLAFDLSAALQSRLLMAAGASTEVRLSLRPQVLRDAEMCVVDNDGCLEFSLWIGDDDDRQWLAVHLPKLAGALGNRLRRRLKVRVFEGIGTSTPLAEQVWPTEGDA